MSRIRSAAFLSVLVISAGGLVEPAVADPASGALLSGEEAVALAKSTGKPVVASALTTESTLIAADPKTGLLTAHLSSGVARVKGADGNWRDPSPTLVPDGSGNWRTEAGAVPVTVSGGGSKVLATLKRGSDTLEFTWAADTLPAPTISANLATYSEVAPGVDLVVRAEVDAVESFLVVKSREAASNPLVRSVPIDVVSAGMAAETLPNKALSFRGSDGQPGFFVPPAYMWDSRGKSLSARLGDLLEPANEASTAEVGATLSKAPSANSLARNASFTASSNEAVSLLDDPATVYPVVIDPSAQSADQTYAVRVTEDFTKFNSDIGSRGKLGYNGWSSPYYKSRMYYQFNWPKNTDGSRITSAQITKAEFQYVQTHSPQHSCTDHTFGPSVQVRLYNTISSGTSWSAQPGVHPYSAVSSDYAVGHEDYCHATYRQKWNITGMIQGERAAYDRQTFTVGIRSASEGDKNGWREYKHNTTGDSPDVEITYEAEPLAPYWLALGNPAPNTTNVTVRPDNVLSAAVSTEGGFACRVTTACLRAEYTIWSGATVVRAAAWSSSAASGGPVTMPVNGLSSGNYTASVRTYNVDTNMYSSPTTFSFSVDLPPGAPTWSWVYPEGWAGAPDLPADRDLSIHVQRGPSDSDAVSFCVYVNGQPFDANGTLDGTCVAADAQGSATINMGTHSLGDVLQVSVSARDVRSEGPVKLDDPQQRFVIF